MTASLIFGKNYASYGVDYTLRAPSVGSGLYRFGRFQNAACRQSNEWDTMLNKEQRIYQKLEYKVFVGTGYFF